MSKLPERLPLPEGRTCADCIHLERCERLKASWSTRRECEWWPSRFRLGKPAPPALEPYYPRHASPGPHWGTP